MLLRQLAAERAAHAIADRPKIVLSGREKYTSSKMQR